MKIGIIGYGSMGKMLLWKFWESGGFLYGDILAANRTPEQTRVQDVMTGRIVSASPNMDVAVAAYLMGREQVRRLPVIEDGKLCGMVSVGDLAEGTHVVTVAIQLDNAIYKVSDVYAEITLTKESTTGEPDTGNGESDENTKPEDEESTEVTTDGTGDKETESTETTESTENVDNTENPAVGN